jgi:flagellin
MGIRVQTNTASLNALRNLSQTVAVDQASSEKLSSGSRVNKAADDAATLSISSKLNAEIRSQSQGIRNASDGISLLQTAEGGLNEISNILVRLRELAIQSSTGTVGQNERVFIDREAQIMVSRISQVAKSTQYNGMKLLASHDEDFQIHMGGGVKAGQEEVYVIDRSEFHSTAARLGLDEMNFSSQDSSQEALGLIDRAINRTSSRRSAIGALQNRITSGKGVAENSNQNKVSSQSQMKDADFAQTLSENAKSKILEMAGMAVLSQANSSASIALKLIG